MLAAKISTDDPSVLNIGVAYRLYLEYYMFVLNGNIQTITETIGAYKDLNLFTLQMSAPDDGPKKSPLTAPKVQFIFDDGFRLPMYTCTNSIRRKSVENSIDPLLPIRYT